MKSENTSYISDDVFRLAHALIDQHTPETKTGPTIDGHTYSTGLAERNYAEHPMFANGAEFPDEFLMDEHDLKVAFDDQWGNHATMFDMRERADHYLDSLDQDGLGLCWDFSTVKTWMYIRESDGLPRIRPSEWWIAGRINGWRDQGGFCEKSMAYLVKHGIPRHELCPSYDRKYDTPAAEADALNHRALEFWETSQDKDKRSHQCLSAWARGWASPVDFNHMGHSMAFCRVVRFGGIGDYDIDCDNSWSMKAGVKGLYRLKGSKARPDACVILRTTMATNT